jgi:hypothetical protein
VLPRLPTGEIAASPDLAPAVVAVPAARDRWYLDEGATSGGTAASVPIPTLRRLLAGQGFGADVVDGPMGATPPGQATPLDFAGDDALDLPLDAGIQREAWLVQTAAGRWWLWEYGASAPADRRADLAQDRARRQAGAEGRGVD